MHIRIIDLVTEIILIAAIELSHQARDFEIVLGMTPGEMPLPLLRTYKLPSLQLFPTSRAKGIERPPRRLNATV